MQTIEMAVFTNMCMIRDGERVLVQDRVKSDWPGVTFPGGHVEPGESFVRSVIREVREETGLEIWNLRLCGIKQFTHPAQGYRYIVLLYQTASFRGELRSSEEGRVFWVRRDELHTYRLADGFDRMLEVFEREDLSENYLWAEDGVWHQENR